MNFFNYWLIHIAGRRTIMLSGFALMDITLIMIGAVAVLGDAGNNNARWAQAGLQMVSRTLRTKEKLIQKTVLQLCLYRFHWSHYIFHRLRSVCHSLAKQDNWSRSRSVHSVLAVHVHYGPIYGQSNRL